MVAAHGYAGAKVGDIAAVANVSRSTFYELFDDKLACFTAAHRQLTDGVVQELELVIARARAPDAADAALAVIATLAEREPAVLVFLTHEALLAGAPARGAYERLMVRLESVVQAHLARSPIDAAVPAVPPRILLGGAARLCCMQLRRQRRVSAETLPALLRWADSYRAPQNAHAGFSPQQLSLAVAPHGPARRWFPRALPRGRHRLPKDVVDTIQRERIAYATAQAVMRCDGSGVAVADIVAAAGVSREVFYAHFADKQQAFLAAQRLIFEQLIAVASSAYFVPDTPWPDRVWDAAAASAAMLAANPAFAHFAFVAAYAIGETGVRLVDETLLAFGLFLQDGYRLGPEDAGSLRVTSDAILLGTMESAADYVRNGRAAELPALVPTVVYMALAPFLGAAAAGDFVVGRLAG